MINGLKVAVAVREDLAAWQKLNVTAFVVSGLAAGCPDAIGDEYVDGSGRAYQPMFGVPVRVFAGGAAALRRAFDRALGRQLTLAVYVDELFATMNDVDNRAAVAAVPTAGLVLSGFAVAGDGKEVDKVFDKLKLHP
jgi:hypothetical protein